MQRTVSPELIACGAWSRSFSRRETVAGSCVWNLARPQKAPARKLRTLQATGLKLASFLQVLTCRFLRPNLEI